MIITCPSCSTRFLLNEADMPESGRKVRCARCSHVWHEQAPMQPAEQPDSTTQPIPDVAVPAQSKASLDTIDPEPRPASATPQLEARADEAEAAPKSKKPMVWALIILVVLGLAAGGAAFFMPDQVQKLLGNSKPTKPAVVAVPAGWGKAPVAEPSQPAPAGFIESETNESETLESNPLQEAGPDAAPVLMPNNNAIFSNTPEGSPATPLSVE